MNQEWRGGISVIWWKPYFCHLHVSDHILTDHVTFLWGFTASCFLFCSFPIDDGQWFYLEILSQVKAGNRQLLRGVIELETFLLWTISAQLPPIFIYNQLFRVKRSWVNVTFTPHLFLNMINVINHAKYAQLFHQILLSECNPIMCLAM